ncbi:nicotinate-nucleotide--dimethylbenzimidazole phosphoribosyltransferase [uncultured Clostridium sp.]|uniref:nicotinate-nucleotide--dimethylbenzimidazole phosphoribosyltransferase n=1 Tax=uncultured Clostridium sp. TaxID=59620 RepID=UPI00261D57B5|nr:nicotinate-nucleotide--dimethylbenzimidazole phosphoribosyltransferase [uncultured Clostridium sp.]
MIKSASLRKDIKSIDETDKEIMKEAKEYIDNLAKPLGSLGELESIAIKLSSITGKVKNKIEKKAIIIMCADNGVVEEHVASAPQYVTLAQTKHFIKGGTGVAALAKENGTDLIVVDIGINSDEKIDGVIDRKIRKGTSNLYQDSAMSKDEVEKAIEIGIEMAEKAAKDGYEILGVGEMGIGNTTSSSAVLCALLDEKIDNVVGKGGGITEASFRKKKVVIKWALKRIDSDDVIEILSEVGGFDICGMAGVFLGAAKMKVPVVIDGFISAVAAMVACRLNPLVKEYLFSSHKSFEIGYDLAMKELELNPILNLNMRLGEGSGCPLAFSIIDFANSMVNNMGTFEDAKIDNSYLDTVREEKNYKVK